jgi:hypothetical protein
MLKKIVNTNAMNAMNAMNRDLTMPRPEETERYFKEKHAWLVHVCMI